MTSPQTGGNVEAALPTRAPENLAEHIRQLLAVNQHQAERIGQLARENGRLRSQVTKLKQDGEVA